MAESTYISDLAASKDELIRVLQDKGIQARHLDFGGPGPEPEGKPRLPTDARSEFLANRAMGDWAENTLAAAIRDEVPDWIIAHYGNAERIAAGDTGFANFYLGVMEEVRKYGKRPDLLVFDHRANASDDIADQSFDALDSLARKALAAIEVRSSKFDALTYMEVRKAEKKTGSLSIRENLSFTVKVEDLKIVYRWLERYKIPESYVQVFYDVVYGINFLDIFRTIASGEGFSIETPEKSQGKATIMIPITSGSQIGKFTSKPEFEVRKRVTRLGRHDAYVAPIGGKLKIDPESLKQVLWPVS